MVDGLGPSLEAAERALTAPPPLPLELERAAAEVRPIARPIAGQGDFNVALQMPTASAELRKLPQLEAREKQLKPKRERYMDRCDPVLRFKVGELCTC